MCGIVGVVSQTAVNQLIYDALLLLQHRGQDAAGIVTQLEQKFFMHKAKGMVRDVFRLARENSPAIVFIDEVDADATKRFDAQFGGDREIQRILLELLTQMDGFDQQTNVKVIMATNRPDTLGIVFIIINFFTHFYYCIY